MDQTLDYFHHEDDYFRRQDAQKRRALREKAEAQARQSADDQQLGDALGVDDAAVVGKARELGFDERTATMLHLVPLVHVAWADGRVTGRERLTIMQAAHTHGAAPGSEASTFLAALLEKRPDETWLAQTHELIRAIVKRRGGGRVRDMVALCRQVAEASGGVLGFGERVSNAEADRIRQFEQALKPDADREVTKIMQR